MLTQLKQFFQWLAWQPGYKARLQYSDADYFNLSEKDTRIATAQRERKAPTLEQTKHVIQTMPTETEIERRNRALVVFTLLTGARDSAIASMKLKHIDLMENCVRRSQDLFTHYSFVALTFAKFVPGLATLASPVAGQSGMRLRKFLYWDGLGSTLWGGSLLAAGYFGRDLLAHNVNLLHWAQRVSIVLLFLIVLTLVIWRIVRHRMALHQLVAARMEPEELKRHLDAGRDIYIGDLRHPLELLAEPFTLPGAVYLSTDALDGSSHVTPRDRDIVLYCTCPSEATSTKTALTLRKLGIERVRPLRGGYDERKRRGFPLEALQPVTLSRQWAVPGS